MGIAFSHAIGFRNKDGEYNILQTMGVTGRVELLARFRLDKLCWEGYDDDGWHIVKHGTRARHLRGGGIAVNYLAVFFGYLCHGCEDSEALDYRFVEYGEEMTVQTIEMNISDEKSSILPCHSSRDELGSPCYHRPT
jgi:hypothetical protein